MTTPVFDFTFVPWFRSVAPYIHTHRGKTFVVAMTGEAIAAGKLASIATDLALIQSMGVRIVLVHGFRAQLRDQLRLKGHEEHYRGGVRITDETALDCAQEAAGQLRFEIEAAFSQGLANTPMAGAMVRVLSGNFLTARPRGVIDGVDFKNTGVVRKVDVNGIRNALNSGAMVLLSPFGFSPTGEAFNLSLEEVATSVAVTMQADKLMFLTECRGVPLDPSRVDASDYPINTEMALDEAHALLPRLREHAATGAIAEYLWHCIQACEQGVERSHILPYATDGVVLLEIYMHDGIGTMVVDEKLENVRRANSDDIARILTLIEPFEHAGALVKRNRTEIERDIDNYTVLEHDGVIFACAALYPYPEDGTGELAALTVAPDSQGQGDGEKILRRIELRARAQGLQSIFVLTTRTMDWFLKRGFHAVSPDRLPAGRPRYNVERKSRVLFKKL